MYTNEAYARTSTVCCIPVHAHTDTVCTCFWLMQSVHVYLFLFLSCTILQVFTDSNFCDCAFSLEKPCPEGKANFFSRVSFWWLNR